ncbi:proteinase-activated receptor 4 isoform X1 [Triplophysa dalaica]|uniref:proteinase-activated receptor 4 isoform X1 n=2 Tax=Triplophysa dalaica TaxID=1582913 RepID=UPI0024DFE8F8|nr:proteinase-activated receptor 4 isoform X1 [Triplophysa dalaica]
MFVISREVFLYLLFVILLRMSSASDERTSIPGRGRALALNNNTLSDEQKEQIQSNAIVLMVPLLGLLAFLIGLPANSLALWVLLFRTKKLPSTILLINLTTCDLLFLLVFPFRIIYHFQGNNWSFGEPFCRIVIALFYGNMYGSVVCLALIAVDRYVALVHPFGAKTFRSNKNSWCMSTLVWIAVAAAAVPLLVSKQSYVIKNHSITTCHDALPPDEQEKNFMPYFVTLFSICFLLPLLVVVFSYSSVLRTLKAEGQRYAHAVRVTALMLIVFVVCFLPSNVLLLLHYSKSDFVQNDLYVPYLISLSLSTFNSCIDPFIFYYVSKDFRKRLCEVLSCYRSNSEASYTSRSKTTLVSNVSKSEGPLKSGTAV